MDELRYPIGKFSLPQSISPDDIRRATAAIEACPAELRKVLRGLDSKQLETPYRDGGWTVRQVVHHLPDSHMNAYIRMKLAMAEDHPTIKPYDEARWAEFDDARNAPIDESLSLLEALHLRWVRFLRSLKKADFGRPLHHPESGDWSIGSFVLLYEWHSKHHVAHITTLRERNGW